MKYDQCKFIIWNSENLLVSLLCTSVCEYDTQSVLLCHTSKLMLVFQCRDLFLLNSLILVPSNSGVVFVV